MEKIPIEIKWLRLRKEFFAILKAAKTIEEKDRVTAKFGFEKGLSKKKIDEWRAQIEAGKT